MADKFAGIAFVVSLVSVAISGAALYFTSTQIQDEREAVLLERRVDGCLAETKAAEAIYRAVANIRRLDPGDPSQDELALVHDALNELYSAAHFELLGPQSLEGAERELIISAEDSYNQFRIPTPATVGKIDRHLEALGDKLEEFSSSCRAALGVFRADERDLARRRRRDSMPNSDD